ncbi:MAG: hypothetical protein AAGG68_17325 [Bacteroidota bacterium]
MDQEYLRDLLEALDVQMQEVRENIETQVRQERQEELDQINAANTQSTFWNRMSSRFTNFRQADQDAYNTQVANQNRSEALEQKIQKEIDRRTEEQFKLMEADVLEEFGGNRDYALSLLEAEEEQRLLTYQEEQEAANEQEETLLIEDQNPQLNNREARLAAQKEKARWNFDVASGRQEQKQEAIQDQARDDFNLESGIEVQRHAELVEILEEVRQDFIQEYGMEMEEQHQETMEEEQEQAEEEEFTVELKAPEKERENTTLDTAYWKQAEQTTAQQDTSSLITTSREDAQLEARIKQSFERSESREEGIAL